ncbi:MAG: type II toxin-antitoxin system RelE/ParE family toxin [Thermodesulfovibrionales bacterium]|nr:type II toxin-antitoxin system RelE/ParE family toxin [Thermodesulfovibrionales bacterium]
MERYKIEFSKKAAKQYKKLSPNYKALIDLALSRLERGLPLDLKPLSAKEGVYRIRVGKYRVLFENIDNVLLIISVCTRGDVYKK